VRSYIDRLHVPLIIALFVIVVVISIVGWAWRPRSGGFPSVEGPEQVEITQNGTNSYTEVLQRTADNGATLTIQAIAASGDVPSGSWTVSVWDPGSATLCTPGSVVTEGGGAVFTVRHQTFTPYEGPLTGGSGPTPTIKDVVSTGPLYVRLCWEAHGPVGLNGAYLNAQFADISANGRSVALTSELYPDGGNTANYTIQTLNQPTDAQPNSWSWTNQKSSFDPVALTGIDESVTQHEAYLNFLSGIAFGVAGGAAISLISELLAPLRKWGPGRTADQGGD